MATKSKSSKKGVSKKTSKAKPKTKKKVMPKTSIAMPSAASMATGRSKPQSFNLLVAALVFIVLIMGYMRFKYMLVPATVNGSPIYSWEYVKSLHQSSGTQVIDQLVVEKLIAQEAKNQDIQVAIEEMDSEFARLEAQFESVGGLDAFLSSQGLKRKDIDKQVELNLKVQKIVAENVSVTTEEVSEYYQTNADLFEDLSQEEAMLEAEKVLLEQKLQQQIGVWIQDLRAKGQVTINFPNAQVQQ